MDSIVNTVSGQQMFSNEEVVRKKHLNHEASIKSIGFLYYVGAIFGIILGIISIGSRSESPLFAKILISSLFIGLGVFQVAVARGLQTLCKWSRIPAIILSSIGLLAFPLGTVVNAYILYLVVCQKGQTVLSDEYKAVIRATPHIRYKTSIVVWIILIVLVTFIATAVIAALVSK